MSIRKSIFTIFCAIYVFIIKRPMYERNVSWKSAICWLSLTMHSFKMFYAAFFILLFAEVRGQDSSVVTLLYTNNTNGYLTECDCGETPLGGLAKRKRVLDRLRRENKPALVVDSGDWLNQFGFDPPKDSMVVRCYEAMGYDAVALGDNEFANGQEFARRVVLSSKLPLVSATLRNQDGTAMAEPYRVLKSGHVRVALIGYIPLAAFNNFPDLKKPKPLLSGDPEQLRKIIGLARNEADVLVLLSHAGYEEDFRLARQFPELNAIVGAHDMVETPDGYRVGSTVIVQTAGNGTQIGVLRLTIKNKSVTGFQNELVPVEFKTTPDPVIQRMVDSFFEPPRH